MKILCIKKSSSDSRPAAILTLPNPKTKKPSKFMVQGNSILEVQKIQPLALSSIIIGQTVLSHGRLLLISDIDPLFIILSKFDVNHSDKYQRIEDLFYDDTYPDFRLVLTVDNLPKRLLNICDKKEVHGMTLFRFSREKTAMWLQTKIKKFASSFTGTNLSNCTKTNEKDDVYRLAVCVLSRYVSDTWISELEKECIPFQTAKNTQIKVDIDYFFHGREDSKTKKRNSHKMQNATKPTRKLDSLFKRL